MGDSDYHWDAKHERLMPGLGLAELEKARDRIAAELQSTIDRGLPMLKGTGFIVIDPTAPRFDGEEFAEVDDARAHASNIAYKSGSAIIYAPLTVMRPKRDVAESTPSKLLQQIIGSQAALPAGAQVADVAAVK